MIDLFYPITFDKKIQDECIAEVSDTLRSRFIGQGPKVEEFEIQFKKLFSVPNAISVNSGTSALETAYDLIKLKEGDEVISTPLTCTATNLPLLKRGVKIIWADILEDTLCIDPLDVRSKLTENTKAIIQVHLGGIKADVGLLHNNEQKKIPVVSDAAQALGIFNGDYTCCSFQAIKHITTADGGLIVCPNEDEARKAKLLRWFGIDREKKIAENWQAYRERQMTFDIEVLGTKRHMNDISAAMGLIGLRHYQSIMEYRKKLFNLYCELLKEVKGIKIIDGKVNTYWLFTVLVEDRDNFAKKMYSLEIDTNVVQVRNDIYSVFGGKRTDLPVMNKVEHKYISLPLGLNVSEQDVHFICSAIRGGW